MEEVKQIQSSVALERLSTLNLRDRLQLIRGKLHRFYAGHFRKSFVTRSLARRQGECARCGACCQLLVRCSFAAECHEGAGCKIYKHRPVNCRIFPLHEQDLAERDLIMPEQKCGYYFED